MPTRLKRTSQQVLCFFLGALLLLITGCASYSKKIDEATLAFRDGDYPTAEQKIQEVLKAERNSLLRHMELGTIRHEQGDYRASNEFFEQAYHMAEGYYGTSIRELMTRASTNAGMLPYKSEVFEKIYIHYYKMLNYIYMAQSDISPEEKYQLLDAVRIEGRRAQIILDDHVFRTGTYEEAEEEKEKLLNQLMGFFAKLNGEVINPRELTFRDNAFMHYIMAVMYEKYGELDNARISYERAANIYDKGYVKQYGLSPAMVDQARFDAARILKIQRDQRWQRVGMNIRSQDLKRQLNEYRAGQNADLLVIQEVDLTSSKGELNLIMTLNSETNLLEIKPLLIGSREEQIYQLSWFYYLYAPKGIINAIQRIQQESYYNPNEVRPKTINMTPLRSVMEEIPGLIQALETGVRLAVPLFYYDDPPFTSHLEIDGKKIGPMLDADSIAGLNMANTLVRAQGELTQAMAVEALRLSSCLLTGMPSYACSLTAAATCMADTRSWLTLPHTIRIQRVALPEGSYQIQIVNRNNGWLHRDESRTDLHSGEIRIIRKRSVYKP
ncbi:hypothetical protein OOT00_07045 [Desulfobotulus sp. H1]|uniref:Tetratricopeptide repeat protein n=1 Tax=Desulfobotulus pelophilus TaxID=2823377 RepID=A0ABT3N8F2_9BACT|nr:hypothetical protein [Desulfobotulus pelophilus]MCW7753738.1 hypothetical protein [Desulfobotulus pelophilus]